MQGLFSFDKFFFFCFRLIVRGCFNPMIIKLFVASGGVGVMFICFWISSILRTLHLFLCVLTVGSAHQTRVGHISLDIIAYYVTPTKIIRCFTPFRMTHSNVSFVGKEV